MQRLSRNYEPAAAPAKANYQDLVNATVTAISDLVAAHLTSSKFLSEALKWVDGRPDGFDSPETFDACLRNPQIIASIKAQGVTCWKGRDGAWRVVNLRHPLNPEEAREFTKREIPLGPVCRYCGLTEKNPEELELRTPQTGAWYYVHTDCAHTLSAWLHMGKTA